MLMQDIKKRLWKEFGGPNLPVEWGETKINQRYWEYLIAVDLLGLTKKSVLIDIGGGLSMFFAQIVADYIEKVYIIDPDCEPGVFGNIVCIKKPADTEVLREVLPLGTHLSCISVFEHISDGYRQQMMMDIGKYFKGPFVATFEFHPKECFFEFQLTTQTLSDMVQKIGGYYPDKILSSPIQSVDTDKWYPLAVKFVRSL